MEDRPALDGESLAAKFVRLCASFDEVAVWLPRRGRLPTAFSELVAMRFLDRLHGRPVTIMYELGVLRANAEELLVNDQADKIAYLRDLRAVLALSTWGYRTHEKLEALLVRLAAGKLDTSSARPKVAGTATPRGHVRPW